MEDKQKEIIKKAIQYGENIKNKAMVGGKGWSKNV